MVLDKIFVGVKKNEGLPYVFSDKHERGMLGMILHYEENLDDKYKRLKYFYNVCLSNTEKAIYKREFEEAMDAFMNVQFSDEMPYQIAFEQLYMPTLWKVKMFKTESEMRIFARYIETLARKGKYRELRRVIENEFHDWDEYRYFEHVYKKLMAFAR